MRPEPGSAGCGCCRPGSWCTSCSRWPCSSAARTGLCGASSRRARAGWPWRSRARPRWRGPGAGSGPRRCGGCSRYWPGRSARAGQPGAFYRGLRTVAIDGTFLHVPDDADASPGVIRKRAGESLEFGYPLLRLLALVECGTRAVLAAAFGPEDHRRTGLCARAAGRAGRHDAAARRRRLRSGRVPAGRQPRPARSSWCAHRPAAAPPAAPPARRLLPGPAAATASSRP